MIFVSTSCIKNKNIANVINELAKNGIKNIELSGGTDYCENIEELLNGLKKKYNLNYLAHNYFPPPKEHFILNLASLDDEIWEKSLNHYKKSIELAINLDCAKYGLHAGFFINPNVQEIGKKMNLQTIYNKQDSIERFVKGFKILQVLYEKNIELYVENNVISHENYKTFATNPFMLTCYDEYLELGKKLKFNLLLDVAHLQVSSNSLNLNFIDEFNKLLQKTNYIHISDNDGKTDMNLMLKKHSVIYKSLKMSKISDKIVSLEINAPTKMLTQLYEEMSKWD